ncbi:MAG: single-stranded-DNA-specific exonuclease RecJ [Candidatus Falkowbacteria bacterium]
MIWQLAPKIPTDSTSAELTYHPLILQLLYNRGFKTPVEIREFFGDDMSLEETGKKYDPFLFRDMNAAVDLVISHIKAGNKIMIYGDYDADGVTATVVLYETLKLLRADVSYYLPDRVSEGYGLNTAAVETLIKDNFKLVITVDTGIRSKVEADVAIAGGMDVIITDHHMLPDDPDDLPQCLIIDPSDATDNYPCRFLAGVGVAFKLVEAILTKSKLDEEQRQIVLDRNLDLVAIGTIADLVRLSGENRLLVKRGLEVLNSTRRLGLQKLIAISGIIEDAKIDSWNIGFQIGPRLNAASRIDHANTALKLLITKDEADAVAIAADLNDKNIERQNITKEIMAEVEKQIDPKNIPPIIVGLCSFEYTAWNEGVIGLVAGRITEKYYRPTLIITHTHDGYKSSGRSIPELDLIGALEDCAEFLDKYGGHPMACGFSIFSQEKLDKFLVAIKENVGMKLEGLELSPKINIDCEVDASIIDRDLIAKIALLAPYGQSNPQPKFVSYQVLVNDIMVMGKDGQHIKIRLNGIWALAFGKSEEYSIFKIGDLVDVVYYLEINEFKGRSEPQMKIVDIKISQ